MNRQRPPFGDDRYLPFGTGLGWRPTLVFAAAFAIAYLLAAQLGLALLTKPEDVAVFWPAAGIAAGALIALGRQARLIVVLGVIAASIAANVMGDRSLWASVFKGFCNAGEALLVSWLIERWFGEPFTLTDLRRLFGFLAATVIATATSAVGGAATMSLLHTDAPFWDIWRAWFVSAGVGIVLIAPLLIEIGRLRRELPRRGEALEGVAALALMALASAYIMTRPAGSWITFSPSTAALPLLLWSAARCPPVFAIAGAFIASSAVICATTFGIGRFGDTAVPITERVLGAQLAVTTVTIFTLVLIALFSERRRHETELGDSCNRLQLALDAAELGVWSVDLKSGRFENDARDRRIHGHACEAPPMTLAEARSLVNPDDLPSLDAAFAASAHSGRSYKAEYRLLWSGGDCGPQRWVAVEGAVLRNAPGQPVQLLGVTRDITEDKLAAEKLQQSERASRKLLEALPAAVYVTDAAGRISYYNAAAVDMWGVEPELGKSRYCGSHRLYQPDGRPLRHEDCPMARALEEKKPIRGAEAVAERPDGVRIPFIPFPTPLFDASGALTGAINMLVDITERKAAEAALADRNAQLALAGQVALVGSFSYDIVSGRMQVSPGYVAIHDLPKGTVETRRSEWRMRVHPHDLPHLDARLEQTIAERRSEHYCDYRIVHSNGEIRWIELRSAISYDRDGAARRIVGANIDVTRHKQAEAAIEESEARLADALSAGQVMAFEWDAATGRSRRSDNAPLILGEEEAGVSGSRRNDFVSRVHADDRQSFKAHLLKLSPTSPTYIANFRFSCPDGRQVWLEETAKGEFDDAGRLLRIRGLTRDITERRELEEHKNVLIAELDHRVKNALTIVSVVASRTQETSSSMADFVAALDGRIRSMATTHELLSFRRWQGIPLAELVRRELAPYATAGNTEIRGPGDVLSAEASQAIAMVLHELATNAAKFGALSAAGGHVSVRWSVRRNGHVHPRLSILWQERGGPKVMPRTRSGYGTSVIRDLVPYELGGTVDLVYAREGVRCKLEIPTHWLSSRDQQGDPSAAPEPTPPRRSEGLTPPPR